MAARGVAVSAAQAPSASSNQTVLPPGPSAPSPMAHPPHRSATSSRMAMPRPASAWGGDGRGVRLGQVRAHVPDADPEHRVPPLEPHGGRPFGVPYGVGGQLGRQQFGPVAEFGQFVGAEDGAQGRTRDPGAARVAGEGEFVLPGFGEGNGGGVLVGVRDAGSVFGPHGHLLGRVRVVSSGRAPRVVAVRMAVAMPVRSPAFPGGRGGSVRFRSLRSHRRRRS